MNQKLVENTIDSLKLKNTPPTYLSNVKQRTYRVTWEAFNTFPLRLLFSSTKENAVAELARRATTAPESLIFTFKNYLCYSVDGGGVHVR